jgi:predicted aspartyl protease
MWMSRVLSLLIFCGAAVAQAPDFKILYEKRDWFRLREAVLAMPSAPALYRAAVAVAFHDDAAAEPLLEKISKFPNDSWVAAEAGRMLGALRQRCQAGVHERIGKPRTSRIRYVMRQGNLHVPVSINGKKVSYLFDTGAGTSVVSESEARRLGLEIRNMKMEAFDGATGGKILVQHYGIARRIRIGASEFRNVVFMIFPDGTYFFQGRLPGENGIIGLPTILSLGGFRWDAGGNFYVGLPPTAARPDPNLALDSGKLLARIGCRNRPLTFSLDTGAVTTGLYVAFRSEFPEQAAAAKKEKRHGAGASGEIDYEALVLPKEEFSVGSFPTRLEPAVVTLMKNLGDGAHGNFGLDLLNQARTVTFDFRAMTLTLEGRPPDARFTEFIDSNQWTELRQAVAGSGAPAYFRGVSACAFNEDRLCEQSLRAAIRSAPGSDRDFAARALLTYHHSRFGRIRKTVEQLKEMRRQRPGAKDVENSLAEFAELARFPDQSVARRAPSRVAFNPESLSVPVTVNAHAAEFSFDFNTSLSAITESEAARLGLLTRPIKGGWSGADGVAVAARLTLGRLELRNVAFHVYRDNTGPFAAESRLCKGRLGLPVLLAMRTIRKTGDRELEIAFPSAPSQKPNLRLDGYGLAALPEANLADSAIKADVLRKTGEVTLDLRTMRLELTR